jgi:predicted DNA-binding protein (UPF0251 family)
MNYPSDSQLEINLYIPYEYLFIMVRPKRCRHVWHDVGFDYFKPRGVELKELEEVVLNVEELEAIRLNDFSETEQVAAAEKMKVSQPTYSRILKEARRKIADALINGKAIKIHGGVYTMPNKDGTGPFGRGMGAGRGLGRGAGRGRMGGQFAAGPGGICVCTSCGHEMTHATGQPCNQIKCPKCNSMMTRK